MDVRWPALREVVHPLRRSTLWLVSFHVFCVSLSGLNSFVPGVTQYATPFIPPPLQLMGQLVGPCLHLYGNIMDV